MRISRPCYDKPHRCPGWVGGGWRSARTYHCEDGRLRASYRRRYWLGDTCAECGTYALPIVTRWLDPTWLWWVVRTPRYVGQHLSYAWFRLRGVFR